MKNRIAHITSVHICSDSRILYRECLSLAKYGFDVTLVGTNIDKKIIDENPSIKFNSTFKAPSRLYRWLVSLPIIVMKVIYHRFKILHLHDPELFIFVPLFKLLGRKVVIDIHEDYFSTLKEKHYLPKFMRNSISKIFRIAFDSIIRKADLIVCAWPKISEIIEKEFKLESSVIRNFPNVDHFELDQNPQTNEKEYIMLFSGLVSFERGIKSAVNIVAKLREEGLDFKLLIVGRFKSEEEKKYIDSLGFSWIEVKTWAPQVELYQIMRTSLFGFILFEDIPNHRFSEPNKLYEYMSVGLPSIVNKLPLLSEVISETGAGLIVDIDFLDISEIKNIVANNEMYSLMSLNGINSVKTKYNWRLEESKLINAYKGLVC